MIPKVLNCLSEALRALGFILPILLPSYARAQEKNVAHQPTEIDSISTSLQAQQFVRQHHKYLTGFLLQTLPRRDDCPKFAHCGSVKKAVSWTKADFDGNGFTDLLTDVTRQV